MVDLFGEECDVECRNWRAEVEIWERIEVILAPV